MTKKNSKKSWNSENILVVNTLPDLAGFLPHLDMIGTYYKRLTLTILDTTKLRLVRQPSTNSQPFSLPYSIINDISYLFYHRFLSVSRPFVGFPLVYFVSAISTEK